MKTYYLYEDANLFRDADQVVAFSDPKSAEEELSSLLQNCAYLLDERRDVLVPFTESQEFKLRVVTEGVIDTLTLPLPKQRLLRFRAIPGHEDIGPFLMGKFPVTVLEWSQLHRRTGSLDGHLVPVTYKSALDAESVLAWHGFRLPTEEEWALAAYGTDKRPYPWGWEEPTDQHLWWCGSGTLRRGPGPVGSCPLGASFFGCEDMAGNVWEWTSTGAGSLRVLRGGSWVSYDPSWVRAGDRFWSTMSFRDDNVGFRCAKSL
jgi:hypothetical protein